MPELIHNFEEDGSLYIDHPEKKYKQMVQIDRRNDLDRGYSFSDEVAVNPNDKSILILSKNRDGDRPEVYLDPSDLVLVKPGTPFYLSDDDGNSIDALTIKTLCEGESNWGDWSELYAQKQWIIAYDRAGEIVEPNNPEAAVIIFRGKSRLRPQLQKLFEAHPAILNESLLRRKQIADIVSPELLEEFGGGKMSPEEMKRYLEMMRYGGIQDGWWTHPYKGHSMAIGYDDYPGFAMREAEIPHIHVSKGDSLAATEVFIPQAGGNKRVIRTLRPDDENQYEWVEDDEYTGEQGQQVWKCELMIEPGSAFVHYPVAKGARKHKIYDSALKSDEPWRSITVQIPGFSGDRRFLKKRD